jgi:hypothetical protein
MDICFDQLVNHELVQRLRCVSQLGLLDRNYDRLLHSLGVASIAVRVSQQLDLPADLAFALRCAALLHDIGTGPYSHSFDAYVCKPLGLVEHETRGIRLVRYVLIDLWFTESDWRDLFVDDTIEFLITRVCCLVLGRVDPSLPVSMVHLLNNPSLYRLDIDRLDYIARDYELLVGESLQSVVDDAIAGMVDFSFPVAETRLLMDARTDLRLKYYPAVCAETQKAYEDSVRVLLKDHESVLRSCLSLSSQHDVQQFCALVEL